jgi:23S rRNA (guanosine2251-2'-O)-methyltransferase
MRYIAVLHDVRSAHNVGSILRSAECFGVSQIVCSGFTPYPVLQHDTRLPHVARSAHAKIQKTALGAEELVPTDHCSDLPECISRMKKDGYAIIAVEQTSNSLPLHECRLPDKAVFIFGNEPNGLPDETVRLADMCVEITQFGQKESLNVSVAAGIVFYEISVRR